jgi:hypothetical protein
MWSRCLIKMSELCEQACGKTVGAGLRSLLSLLTLRQQPRPCRTQILPPLRAAFVTIFLHGALRGVKLVDDYKIPANPWKVSFLINLFLDGICISSLTVLWFFWLFVLRQSLPCSLH